MIDLKITRTNISLVFKYAQSHYSENNNEIFSIIAGLEEEEMVLILNLCALVYQKERTWKEKKELGMEHY